MKVSPKNFINVFKKYINNKTTKNSFYYYNENKIQNGSYLVINNNFYYQPTYDLDINLSGKSYVLENYFPELIMSEHPYFKYFKGISEQNEKKVNSKSIDNFFNKNVSIRGNVKRTSINGENHYLLGYQIPISRLEILLSELKKRNLSPFYCIDLNLYNPHQFFNEVILYFIDLILMTISGDRERISRYLRSIFIISGEGQTADNFEKTLQNILLNLYEDKTFREKSKKYMKNDMYFNYFSLMANKKICGLGNITINAYLYFKEVNGFLINMTPMEKDNKIVFEQNNKSQADKAINVIDDLNDFMKPLTADFWNLYDDTNLVINDKLGYYYEDEIKNMYNNLFYKTNR